MRDHIHFTKLVFCGAPKVGKSTIISAILDRDITKTTKGIGITSFLLSLEKENLNFSIWDTNGDEQYQELVNLIFRGADIVILVFDLGKLENFEHINYLMDQALIYSGEPKPYFIIVGNKSDLPRAITEAQIKEIIEEQFYFETNAINREGVDKLFSMLVELAQLRQKEATKKDKSMSEDHSLSSIDLEKRPMKSGCC